MLAVAALDKPPVAAVFDNTDPVLAGRPVEGMPADNTTVEGEPVVVEPDSPVPIPFQAAAADIDTDTAVAAAA